MEARVACRTAQVIQQLSKAAATGLNFSSCSLIHSLGLARVGICLAWPANHPTPSSSRALLSARVREDQRQFRECLV
jgi:hypothetical protein